MLFRYLKAPAIIVGLNSRPSVDGSDFVPVAGLLIGMNETCGSGS